MLRIVLIASVAGAISTAAMAQPAFTGEPPEPTTNSSMTADPSATDPNKVVCKASKPPTGTRVRSSRTRTKVCMTKAEWDIQAAEAQEAARNSQNNGEFSAPSENSPN